MQQRKNRRWECLVTIDVRQKGKKKTHSYTAEVDWPFVPFIGMQIGGLIDDPKLRWPELTVESVSFYPNTMAPGRLYVHMKAITVRDRAEFDELETLLNEDASNTRWNYDGHRVETKGAHDAD
jgi:hypothetical protein